jgi:hypothetical protein
VRRGIDVVFETVSNLEVVTVEEQRVVTRETHFEGLKISNFQQRLVGGLMYRLYLVGIGRPCKVLRLFVCLQDIRGHRSSRQAGKQC